MLEGFCQSFVIPIGLEFLFSSKLKQTKKFRILLDKMFSEKPKIIFNNLIKLY